MAKFQITAHGRLQDWIADEKGYFSDEGLDYEIKVVRLENEDQGVGAASGGDVRVGAYELYGSGGRGKQDMSCACHWAVNQAATDHHGRMWGHAYSVIPGGIYVRADSKLRHPGDLSGVEVAVGYHSGSHFSTLQALEACLDADDIRLSFIGMPYDRVDALLRGQAQASNIWGAATYLVEQQGCRKIVDSTFMAGFMFAAHLDVADVERYFRGLKRAQMELDLEPEPFKHHYLKEIPARFHDLIDVGGFGTGERVVFLPYTAEMYQRSQAWMQERHLFEGVDASPPAYQSVVQV